MKFFQIPRTYDGKIDALNNYYIDWVTSLDHLPVEEETIAIRKELTEYIFGISLFEPTSNNWEKNAKMRQADINLIQMDPKESSQLIKRYGHGKWESYVDMVQHGISNDRLEVLRIHAGLQDPQNSGPEGGILKRLFSRGREGK